MPSALFFYISRTRYAVVYGKMTLIRQWIVVDDRRLYRSSTQPSTVFIIAFNSVQLLLINRVVMYRRKRAIALDRPHLLPNALGKIATVFQAASRDPANCSR